MTLSQVLIVSSYPHISKAIRHSLFLYRFMKIGAGPTALILALSLAQNGIAVRIIEKLDKPSEAQRGIGMQVS